MALGSNVQTAYRYLIGKGVSPTAAAGLVGNLMQESLRGGDIDPLAVGDGGASRGIGQWNGPRAEALAQFAQGRGGNADDLTTQLDFMLHELGTSESKARDAIFGAETPKDAALAASRLYWRPGDPRNENRMLYAMQADRELAREAAAEAQRDRPVTSILDLLESFRGDRVLAENATPAAAGAGAGSLGGGAAAEPKPKNPGTFELPFGFTLGPAMNTAMAAREEALDDAEVLSQLPAPIARRSADASRPAPFSLAIPAAPRPRLGTRRRY